MSLRRLLRGLVIAGCLIGGVVPAGQASAAEEREVCAVGSAYLASSSTCINEGPPAAGRYQVLFELKDQPAGVTDYAWTVTPAGRVQSGCTSTSYYCLLSVPNVPAQYYASVTYSSGGIGRSFQSTAYVEQWCGSYYC
jgi:hypothetical protein